MILHADGELKRFDSSQISKNLILKTPLTSNLHKNDLRAYYDVARVIQIKNK